MKAKTIFVSILTLLFIAISIFFSFSYILRKISFKDVRCEFADFEETSDFVQNPYCGFYHLYGFALTGEDSEKAQKLIKSMQEDRYMLALLEINLREFRSENLSPQALSELDTLLSGFDDCSKSYILRFVYDWNGKAKETEPESISQILTHMEQIAPYVNRHKQSIYIMQGTFAGDCGEMHGSAYTNNADMITLINQLHKLIDPDIFLAVRTPAHYRTINGSFEPLTKVEAYSKSLKSRLGLFNDGMLGSDIDLGTYGTSTIQGKTEPDAKGTRAEEIAFQNLLCSYVPNGGECVLDNPFNDFENAVSDLEAMHVSYLNCDYDKNVLDKWAASTYSKDGTFNGVSGYDYIKAHLGYRYVITDAQLHYERYKSHTAGLSVSLKNTGFSSAYRRFSAQMTLISDDFAQNYPIDFDNRMLLSNTEASLNISIDCSELSRGSYNIYLKMTDTTRTQAFPINFANSGEMTEHGIYIGTLTIE